MRGPLIFGVTGDGGSEVSKRANRSRHQTRPRLGAGKRQFFEREANGMGGCCSGDRAAGQHASNRADQVSAISSEMDF
jgi:hypothetical protein